MIGQRQGARDVPRAGFWISKRDRDMIGQRQGARGVLGCVWGQTCMRGTSRVILGSITPQNLHAGRPARGLAYGDDGDDDVTAYTC